MQAHLLLEPLLIVERFRLHKRNQTKEETIVAYVAELKRLSGRSEFGTGLADVFCDRLVCGIRHEGIQKRLLTEADLAFKRALEIAVLTETAAKDALQLQDGVRTEHINQLAVMRGAIQKQTRKNVIDVVVTTYLSADLEMNSVRNVGKWREFVPVGKPRPTPK